MIEIHPQRSTSDRSEGVTAMTMDAYALCERPPASMAAWQRSIDGLGFGLVLRATRDLDAHRGHLPATWRGHEAGFGFGPGSFADLTETYDEINFQGVWPCVYAFHFATLPACLGTWIALTGLVTLTGGRAFDAQEGLVLTAERALRYTQAAADRFDVTLARLNGIADRRH